MANFIKLNYNILFIYRFFSNIGSLAENTESIDKQPENGSIDKKTIGALQNRSAPTQNVGATDTQCEVDTYFDCDIMDSMFDTG